MIKVIDSAGIASYDVGSLLVEVNYGIAKHCTNS